MTASDPAVADYRVLCAGAVRIGVERCMDEYGARTGARGTATHVNGPALRTMVESGNHGAEVVVAPGKMLTDLWRAGLVNRAPQHAVGRVVAGGVVRSGGPVPDFTSLDAFKAALVAADAVLFARGTIGGQIEDMVGRIGLAEIVGRKTVRCAHGSDVVSEIATGAHGNAIGFGQSTELRRVIEQGAAAVYVGAFPEGIAIQTRYMAGLAAGPQPRVARRFVRFLGNVAARPILVASGIAQDGG